jgi:membrane-associated protease RseP (regulator of RpoE activity)
MLNAWQIIIAWFIIYTVGAFFISRKYESENVDISGPFLTIRSRKGLKLVEWLSTRAKNVWLVWGNLGIVAAVVSGLIGLVLIGTSAYAVLQSPTQVSIQGPTDALVIPGVNRFIPVSATPQLLIGLILGIVVHEGGHAIYCRTGDISIKSTGVFLGALIPLGAFVEPDEEEQWAANTMDQLRMYSAGIMNNFLIFVVSSILLLLIVSTLVSPVSGLGVMAVLDGSPADEAGIQQGDIITEADGVEISDAQEFNSYSANNTVQTVVVNGNKELNLPEGAFISQVPTDFKLSSGSNVISVNGVQTSGSIEFYQELKSTDDIVATVETENNTYKIPVGAYGVVTQSNGFSSTTNISQGDTLYIYSVNEQRVYDRESLQTVLNNSSGQVEIRYGTTKGQSETITATSEDIQQSAAVANRVSGIGVTTLGINLYPKEQFYDIMSFDESFLSTVYNIIPMMFLPVAELSLNLGTSFSGFTGYVTNFYTTSGIIPSWIIFSISGTLLWTAWINFNLGLFNCLPTFALDGGHILRTSIQDITSGYISEDAQTFLIRSIKLLVVLLILSVFFLPLLS